MHIQSIQKPIIFPVTLAEVKAHCQIDHDDHDTMLTSMIGSAVSQIDGVSGWLGRALLTQDFRLWLPNLSGTVIHLPLPPLQAVIAVRYMDTAGATKTVSATEYHAVTDVEPGYIELSGSWPSDIADRRLPAWVDFEAGYGDDEEDVPEIIRHYIKLSVAEAYTRRELSEMGIVMTPNKFWQSMLEGWRFRMPEGI